MKTRFRFPGKAEYAFAELETTDGGVPDNHRELREVGQDFLGEVGRVLQDGCTIVTMAPLNPQYLGEYDDPQHLVATPDGAREPVWAQNGPQEAQGYQHTGQGGYAPQNGSQGYAGAYQPQQGYQTQAASQQPNNPPGAQAPICQMHGQPAKYKPAGVSQKTNRPYNAFWVCATGANDCTRASNFPKP